MFRRFTAPRLTDHERTIVHVKVSRKTLVSELKAMLHTTLSIDKKDFTLCVQLEGTQLASCYTMSMCETTSLPLPPHTWSCTRPF